LNEKLLFRLIDNATFFFFFYDRFASQNPLVLPLVGSVGGT